MLGATAAAVTAACGDGHSHRGRGGGSGIVFGISQKTDPETGKVTSRAGYEYLELARKGGWATSLARLGDDGVCIFEELDRRLGRPHVGDGGRAHFDGGRLPREGLVMNANEEDPELDGRAFLPGGELSFSVDFGFGIPDIPGVPLLSPRGDLAVVAPPAGDLSLDPTRELDVAWSVPTSADRPSRVMVALETEDADGRGNEVRCFFDEDVRAGVIPSSMIRKLGGAGTKGVVQIASHRQVSVLTRGGWTVYVIGAIFHRAQPFVFTAN